MARPGAQAKLGFFPAHRVAIDGILGHLQLPSTGITNIHIIDPCAGEGAAIKQIADGLGVPYEQTYAVELDGNRVEKVRESMPGAHVCGPASFLGMKITGYSFGLAYVNPPFDSELGGGRREEQSFVEEAYRILVPGGTLVLVCPISALIGNRNFCEYLDARFENLRMFAFPDGSDPETSRAYRSFKEIVVIANRRRELLTQEFAYRLGSLSQAGAHYMTQVPWEQRLTRINAREYTQIVQGRVTTVEPLKPYVIKSGWKPHQFHKSQYLPHELKEALAASPLQKLLLDVEPTVLARPPVPPGKGHVALLLASGMLDGVVEAADGNHVVRGTAKKVEYYNEAESKSSENPETGALTTKDVYSQKIVLVIRAVWPDGEISTLSDQPADKEAIEPDEVDDEPELNAGRHIESPPEYTATVTSRGTVFCIDPTKPRSGW